MLRYFNLIHPYTANNSDIVRKIVGIDCNNEHNMDPHTCKFVECIA